MQDDSAGNLAPIKTYADKDDLWLARDDPRHPLIGTQYG